MEFRAASLWDTEQIASSKIREMNPSVLSLGKDWKLYRDCYSSSGGFIDGSYLSPFPGEAGYTGFDKLGERKRLASYEIPADYRKYNDIYAGYLTQERPVVKVLLNETNLLDTDEGWQAVMDDADGEGSSFTDVAKDLILEALITGSCACVVDQPFVEIVPTNQQERIGMKLWPFARLIGIENIIDWEFDPNGQFEWVKIGEGWDQSKQAFETYKVWTKAKWILFGHDGKRIIEGLHPCGEVPVVIFYGDRTVIDDIHCHPLLRAVAHLDVAEYNRMSELTEVLRNCAFPRYYGPPLDKDTGQKGQAGTLNYIQVQQGDQTPGVLNADTGAPASIQAAIESIRIKKQDLSGLPESSGQPVVESGVAKSYRFRQLERRLVGLGKLFERPLRSILRLFAGWIGGMPASDDYTFKVNMPDSYDVFSVKDDLDLLTSMDMLSGMSPTLKKEIHKRMAQKLLPQDSDDVYAIIKAEIENDLSLSLRPDDENRTDNVEQMPMTASQPRQRRMA